MKFPRIPHGAGSQRSVSGLPERVSRPTSVPPGGFSRHSSRSARSPVARFPGTEPVADYPIHIIVKQGRIMLLGVVDNESDKTVAGMRAGGVRGSFGVDNELMVDHPAASKSITR